MVSQLVGGITVRCIFSFLIDAGRWAFALIRADESYGSPRGLSLTPHSQRPGAPGMASRAWGRGQSSRELPLPRSARASGLAAAWLGAQRDVRKWQRRSGRPIDDRLHGAAMVSSRLSQHG